MRPLRSVIVLSTAAAALHLAAQPTISAGAISRVPGEHFQHAYCDTVPVSAPGPDQLWDFSAVTGCAATLDYAWTAPSGSATFSYTAVEHLPQSSSLNFYTATEDAFQLVAVAPLPNDYSIYTDPADQVHYPMQYGDTFTDAFSGTRSNPPGETVSGKRTVTYDAYGSVVMPWGTVDDVFRLHTHDTLRQVIYDFLSYTIDVYDLYAPGLHDPLVRIYQKYGLDGTYFGGATWLYVPAAQGVEEIGATAPITLAPDPVVDRAAIRTDLHVTGIQAIDAWGRVLAVPFIVNTGTLDVDLSPLAPGLYSLLLASAEGPRYVRCIKR